MRTAGPDPCGVLAPPIQVNLALAAGGILPAQTLYVTQTWLTPWGETSGSVEQTIDVTPRQSDAGGEQHDGAGSGSRPAPISAISRSNSRNIRKLI